MKRSLENSVESEQQISDKIHRTEDVENLDLDSDSSDSSSECIESSTDSQIYDNRNVEETLSEPFCPSEIEKQIISHSLAMIRRANSNDWNLEISDENDIMILQERCVISFVSYNIMTEVYYTDERTICRITYSSDTTPYILCYSWNNYSNIINISKLEVERYYIICSRTVQKFSVITPQNCRSDSWCYFQDARDHIMEISL